MGCCVARCCPLMMPASVCRAGVDKSTSWPLEEAAHRPAQQPPCPYCACVKTASTLPAVHTLADIRTIPVFLGGPPVR